MGCDIHAHIELMINERWHHYSVPRIKRRYVLFEKIAGVRGDVCNAIVPPRGIPHDLSTITEICYDKEQPDSHTPTWLTKEEFLKVVEWGNNNLQQDWKGQFEHEEIGYLTGSSFNLHPNRVPPQITDVRFICWFDN